jgi:hypothetical protein
MVNRMFIEASGRGILAIFVIIIVKMSTFHQPDGRRAIEIAVRGPVPAFF